VNEADIDTLEATRYTMQIPFFSNDSGNTTDWALDDNSNIAYPHATNYGDTVYLYPLITSKTTSVEMEVQFSQVGANSTPTGKLWYKDSNGSWTELDNFDFTQVVSGSTEEQRKTITIPPPLNSVFSYRISFVMSNLNGGGYTKISRILTTESS
jgi:hypothetical protein